MQKKKKKADCRNLGQAALKFLKAETSVLWLLWKENAEDSISHMEMSSSAWTQNGAALPWDMAGDCGNSYPWEAENSELNRRSHQKLFQLLSKLLVWMKKHILANAEESAETLLTALENKLMLKRLKEQGSCWRIKLRPLQHLDLLRAPLGSEGALPPQGDTACWALGPRPKKILFC